MTRKFLLIGSGAMFAAVSFAAISVVAGASVAAVPPSVVANPINVASPISVGLPLCPVFSRSLSMGISGSDVTQLQAYLNAQGYLSVSPTGYFGPLTQAAVARWQAQGGVVALGGFGSGTFGPLSRGYFTRSCTTSGGSGGGYGGTGSGGSGSSTQSGLSFSATPNSGIAPLTVQFVASAPQGTTIGNSINFGDGTSGSLGFVPVCSNCNAMAAGSHTYTAPGTYTATLTSGSCACPANGVCNCPNMMILATTTVTVTGVGSSLSTTSGIQQLNAPGSVALAVGGIAEIRNASFYFTLANLSASTALIDITPVGCWNSFPSDPIPVIHCMLAVVPTPPQTLSVGQKYAFGNYNITLTSITTGTATFSVQ